MEIKRLFNTILRKLWIVIALSVMGGILAWYAQVYDIIPLYKAETTIYAMNKGKVTPTGSGLNYQDLMVSRQLVQDYGEIIGSEKVITQAMGELKDIKVSLGVLRSMISVSVKKDSSVMSIRGTSNDPEVAAAVANAVSRAFISQIREMTNSDIVGILDEAKVPGAPIPSNDTKKVLIGVLAGLALALLIIYFIEFFDTTIRIAEDVEENLKLRIIGIIPEHSIK